MTNTNYAKSDAGKQKELEDIMTNMIRENQRFNDNANEIYAAINRIKNIRLPQPAPPDQEKKPEATTFVDRLTNEVERFARLNDFLVQSKEGLEQII